MQNTPVCARPLGGATTRTVIGAMQTRLFIQRRVES